MTNALEKNVGCGVPVTICTRCGWWQTCAAKPDRAGFPYIDKILCPDCNSPLDGVNPRG